MSMSSDGNRPRRNLIRRHSSPWESRRDKVESLWEIVVPSSSRSSSPVPKKAKRNPSFKHSVSADTIYISNNDSSSPIVSPVASPSKYSAVSSSAAASYSRRAFSPVPTARALRRSASNVEIANLDLDSESNVDIHRVEKEENKMNDIGSSIATASTTDSRTSTSTTTTINDADTIVKSTPSSSTNSKSWGMTLGLGSIFSYWWPSKDISGTLKFIVTMIHGKEACFDCDSMEDLVGQIQTSLTSILYENPSDGSISYSNNSDKIDEIDQKAGREGTICCLNSVVLFLSSIFGETLKVTVCSLFKIDSEMLEILGSLKNIQKKSLHGKLTSTELSEKEALEIRLLSCGIVGLKMSSAPPYNMRFQAWPPFLSLLVNIKYLSLHKHDIKEIGSSIGLLMQLEHINLNDNGIEKLPDEIGYLGRLSQLHLNHNQLSTLPDGLGQLGNLTSLHLSHNKLALLPSSINCLIQLRHLYLSHNYLTSFPKFTSLLNLQTLYLDHNHYKTPMFGSGSYLDNLSCLASLKLLDMSHNSLSVLPPSLTSLPVLEVLIIHHNYLSSVNVTQPFPSLKILDVRDNQTYAITGAFHQLENLETLLLSSNRFPSSTEFPVPPTLQTLYFSHNRHLGHLPVKLVDVISIVKLELQQCHLEDLPDEFGNLKSLISVNISLNNLKTLPLSFCNLVQLQHADISYNNLTSLPAQLGQLQCLHSLLLHGNPLLLDLPPSFHLLQSLQHLSVANLRVQLLNGEYTVNKVECAGIEKPLEYKNDGLNIKVKQDISDTSSITDNPNTTDDPENGKNEKILMEEISVLQLASLRRSTDHRLLLYGICFVAQQPDLIESFLKADGLRELVHLATSSHIDDELDSNNTVCVPCKSTPNYHSSSNTDTDSLSEQPLLQPIQQQQQPHPLKHQSLRALLELSKTPSLRIALFNEHRLKNALITLALDSNSYLLQKLALETLTNLCHEESTRLSLYNEVSESSSLTTLVTSTPVEEVYRRKMLLQRKNLKRYTSSSTTADSNINGNGDGDAGGGGGVKYESKDHYLENLDKSNDVNKQDIRNDNDLLLQGAEEVRGSARKFFSVLGEAEVLKPIGERGVRILSLDGGGVRGLVSVLMLKKLEEMTGHRICDMFDMIVGTSTGSLIAVLTAVLHLSMAEIKYIYLHMCSKGFVPHFGGTVSPETSKFVLRPGMGVEENIASNFDSNNNTVNNKNPNNDNSSSDTTFIESTTSISANILSKQASKSNQQIKTSSNEKNVVDSDGNVNMNDMDVDVDMDNNSLSSSSSSLRSVPVKAVSTSARPSAWWSFFNYTAFLKRGSWYGTDAYEMLLKDALGDQALVDSCAHTDAKICLVAAQVNTNPPDTFAFRNYNFPIGVTSKYSGSCEYLTWEAIRASTAAPSYFDIFVKGEKMFRDGGLTANNPTGVAIHEAKLLWQKPIDLVLSCGTGRREKRKEEKPDSYSAILNQVVASCCETEFTHRIMEDLLPYGTYYRMQPQGDAFDVELDETSQEKLSELEEATSTWISNNSVLFEALSRKLQSLLDQE